MNQLRPRVHLAAFAALAAVLLLPGAGRAFHERGAANCDGCHIMHAAQDGQVLLDGSQPLLLRPSPSDVCLVCHGGQDGVFGANPMVPPAERGAGNFVFLLEDNINDAPDGLTDPLGGHAAGHSIVSVDYGVGTDPDWPYAPGGSFPAAELGCTSCHDPHGNANFRMLHGVGPVQDGLFQFAYPAPQAEGLDAMDPLAVESPMLHTAYRSGMASWCANCHGQYHDTEGQQTLEHDFDRMVAGQERNTYNAYNGTDDPYGGQSAFAYIPQVPFEDAMNTVTGTVGPGTGSRIPCITCHRAHATSAPRALRWDQRVGLLAQDGQVSGSYALPSPYPTPTQDSLCNKCHYGHFPD